MQSRMDKYHDNNIDPELEEGSLYGSRIQKNQELYKEVGNLELHEFDLNSNASVIGDSNDNIYLDEIQDILSEKYREDTRRKSFGDTDEISLPKINLDETREYDLNSVLEKAKENKESNYEEDRLRKVRDSQYDVLKDLENLSEEEIGDNSIDSRNVNIHKNNAAAAEELLGLINTIVNKEKENGSSDDLDPLDILSDLRGDDDTKVMGAIQMDDSGEYILDESSVEVVERGLDDTDEDEVVAKGDEVKVTKVDEVKVTKVDDDTLSDSFMTASVKITEEDFDDFDDLKEKGGFGKFLLKFVIFLIIVVFVVGLVVLANKFLNLGLF